MARLRLLFALSLLSLGTWWGALAISGYYEPGRTIRTGSTPASVDPAASPSESQFIGLLSKERFVAAEAPAARRLPRADPRQGLPRRNRLQPRSDRNRPPPNYRGPSVCLAISAD